MLLFATMLCALPAAAAEDVPAPSEDGLGLSVSMSVGLGWISMGRFHDGLDAFGDTLQVINPDITVLGRSGTHTGYSVTPRVRLLFLRKNFVELGVGYLRNHGQIDIDIGGLSGVFSYQNSSVEIPILFGTQLAEFRTGQSASVRLSGALGPSVLMFNRSDWSYDRGQATDFRAGRGGGFEAMLGAQMAVTRRLSVHVQLRYKYLVSGNLQMSGPRLPPVPELEEQEYSGVYLNIGAGWRAL